MKRHFVPLVVALGLLSTGCATTTKPAAVVDMPATPAEQAVAQQAAARPAAKLLKRKIAIGRFTNETRYGKTFLRDGDTDPLGKQASDMLSSRLVESGQFLVFERPDIQKLEREQALSGAAKLIGVDALILGSVTEFGRQNVGKEGFLSQTKMQVARAKVELRLVDPATGHVYFSATGAGEASVETGSVAGYGSTADYDQTLNDRAIGAAISDVLNSLVGKLTEQKWHTDILSVKDSQVFMSGGTRQGLKAGDTLAVYRRGQKVASQQTGFEIELPPERLAGIRVLSFFGDNESNEGSIAEIVSGSVPAKIDDLFIGEEK